MNNNLIPKNKISFWEHIRIFWKTKILKKFNTTNIEKIENFPTENYVNDKTKFAEEIRVVIEKNISKENEFKQFIKEIEDNPDLINNLSNERLDKLIEYYEKIIIEKQKKIEKLKLSIN